MVFSVISFERGITAGQLARAAKGAPACTASSAPYQTLLDDAGWVVEDIVDVTPQFRVLSVRERAAYLARSESLRDILGASEFSEQLAYRDAKVAGIEDGLIRRHLYLASPAG
jgi:hypothetical protein